MKNLIAVMVLLLAVSVAFSQTVPREDQLKSARLGTALTNKAYTTTTKDTTQAFDVRGWTKSGVVFWFHDSASAAVYYQPSYDGNTFLAPVFVDSVSSDTDSSSATVIGRYWSAAVPAAAQLYPRIRFTVEFGPFRTGVTSARYSGKLVRVP